MEALKAIKIVGNKNDGRAVFFKTLYIWEKFCGHVRRVRERGVNSILTTILRF